MDELLPAREMADRAFINIAYAAEYEVRLMAYICALSLFGFVPTAAISEYSNPNRLERIIDLIADARVSIHDLSWVELDDVIPRTPRFNMPFELGLAVAAHRERGADYVIFDTRPFRLDKALSDVKGVDVLIHDGSPTGVFCAMADAFADINVTRDDFNHVFKAAKKEAARLKNAGYESLFRRLPFNSLRRVAANAAASRLPATSSSIELAAPTGL